MNEPHCTSLAHRRIPRGWIALVALLAIAGCREITAPAEPAAKDPRIGLGLVLDDAGEPSAEVYVTLDNRGFVPHEDRLDWQGRTDTEGHFRPDLPPGSYRVQVDIRVSGLDTWERGEVQLGPDPFTLDPRPYLEYGTVTTSDPAFPVEDMEVRFETRVSHPFGSQYLSSRGSIDAQGRFRVVRAAEGTYEVRLQGSGVGYYLARDLALPADDPLEFELNVIRQQVELSLGGGDAPTGNCSLRASVGDDYIDGSYFIEANRVSYWAPPGVGTLDITPRGGMPFRRQARYWEFGEGARPIIELGRWYVEILYITPQGAPLHGCSLRLASVDEQRSAYYSGFGPTFSLYLNDGGYLITSECSGYEQHQLGLIVDGPESTTVMMQPAP